MRKYKILAISDAEILRRFSVEQLKEKFSDIDFILGAGDLSYEYLDYVFVNEIGDIITPDYVSRHLNDILEKNGMRHIRFHDLRHTCASLMIIQNVSMKEIQIWLGHSDFATTANIYAHIDSSAKVSAYQLITIHFGSLHESYTKIISTCLSEYL